MTLDEIKQLIEFIKGHDSMNSERNRRVKIAQERCQPSHAAAMPPSAASPMQPGFDGRATPAAGSGCLGVSPEEGSEVAS